VLISHERRKLFQAIVFFSEHTRKLGKTKLFKLLYFLDFEHFKRTGRSVTGLAYFAWPKGPVPKQLHEEFADPPSDLLQHVGIETIRTLRGPMEKPVAKVSFDSRLFSKRELQLMRDLAARYRNATAEEMIEDTHLENKPWHEVYDVQGLKQSQIPYAQIPYELALNKQEADEMRRHIRERQEVVDNYKNDTDDGSGNDSF
jgi:uncharacterized phage-associated protein